MQLLRGNHDKEIIHKPRKRLLAEVGLASFDFANPEMGEKRESQQRYSNLQFEYKFLNHWFLKKSAYYLSLYILYPYLTQPPFR